MTPLIIGRHRGQRAGDLIEMTVHGALSLADITALHTASMEVIAEQGRCFLIGDVTAMTGLDAEARRMMATWSKTETERLSGTAMYGCGFAVRTLITLTLNAIHYFGKHPMDAVFVRDEAEARSWVNTQRSALEEKVQHGG
jgi:hypothetical protein